MTDKPSTATTRGAWQRLVQRRGHSAARPSRVPVDLDMDVIREADRWIPTGARHFVLESIGFRDVKVFMIKVRSKRGDTRWLREKSWVELQRAARTIRKAHMPPDEDDKP